MITAASSSFARLALEACMKIRCAVDARGSGNLVARAVSSISRKQYEERWVAAPLDKAA
ncbi:MAG: hypothetical protein JNM79_19905 [Burkholderiales bacterium]|nr:hypothetical protein [Burkholderiales bacterium]